MACRGSAVRVRLAPFLKSIAITRTRTSFSKVLSLVLSEFSSKVSAFRNTTCLGLNLGFFNLPSPVAAYRMPLSYCLGISTVSLECMIGLLITS